MVTESEFDEFVKCLDSHDPLDAFIPKSLDAISGKWSCADAKYLPALLSMLKGTVGSTETAFEREKNNERRFFYLDAICKIDQSPQAVPAVVSDCLFADEDAIRRMALKYVSKAKSIDDGTRTNVDRIICDGGAYIGTRMLAYFARSRIKRRPPNQGPPGKACPTNP